MRINSTRVRARPHFGNRQMSVLTAVGRERNKEKEEEVGNKTRRLKKIGCVVTMSFSYCIEYAAVGINWAAEAPLCHSRGKTDDVRRGCSAR